MNVVSSKLNVIICAGAISVCATGALAGSYEGQMNSKYRFDGAGKFSYDDGTVFSGSWQSGRKTGPGQIALPDGTEYKGQWQDNLPHGMGAVIFPNGDIYTGEFVRGNMNGSGTYTWANGDIYEGQFLKGKISGAGVKSYANGDEYEGGFKSGLRHGQGQYMAASGAQYQGSWSDGLPDGRGTMRFADGSVYEGEWKRGRFSGVGTLTWSSGEQYSGDWVDGALHGKGKLVFSSKAYYEGDFLEGQRAGWGYERESENYYFEGDFSEDAGFAHGTCFSNGALMSPCKHSYDEIDLVVPSASYKQDGQLMQLSLDSSEYLEEEILVMESAETEQVLRQVAKPEQQPASPAKGGAVEELPAVADDEEALASEEASGTKKRRLGGWLKNTFKGVSTAVKSVATKANEATMGAIETITPGTKDGDGVDSASEPENDASRAAGSDSGVNESVTSDQEDIEGVAGSGQSKADTGSGEMFSLLHDDAAKQSKVYYEHNLVAGDVHVEKDSAFWEKKRALFSQDVKINVESGKIGLSMLITDYKGPGVYMLGNAKVKAYVDGREQAASLKDYPGRVVITREDDEMLEGRFDVTVYKDGDPEGKQFSIRNGQFTLAER